MKRTDRMNGTTYSNEFGVLYVNRCADVGSSGDQFSSTFVYNYGLRGDGWKWVTGRGRSVADSLLCLVGKSGDDRLNEWVLGSVI